MKQTRIQCPAKINLDLKIVGKREDGFHNIESIMQTISLYDYLNIKVNKSEKNEILLSGNSNQIPYDKSNLVYKATELFLNANNLNGFEININIEKNIPISAGLAGGSTNAAGTFFGLNKVFDNIMTNSQMHELCAQLGSDLNFCLRGGRAMTRGRGEILEPLDFIPMKINLIKPINLGISAKEAYTKFAQKKPCSNTFTPNDLEWAVFEDYSELQYIKKKYPTAIMTGSGSTYFSTEEEFTPEENYWVKNNLHATPSGVDVVE
jgi:4-diphosphocytidyl-2-C-methyl-D-erythritol kinase